MNTLPVAALAWNAMGEPALTFSAYPRREHCGMTSTGYGYHWSVEGRRDMRGSTVARYHQRCGLQAGNPGFKAVISLNSCRRMELRWSGFPERDQVLLLIRSTAEYNRGATSVEALG